MISKKNIILIVACMAVFFEALDIAIINLAMPLIQNEFAIPASDIHWAQTLYILLYGGFLIVGGKLSDLFGRRRMFLIGAALFLVTSFGAGLSQEFYLLVAFRGLQGLAAALLMPAALSIITTTFTDHHERSKAIGIFSSFAAIGSGCGLSLGGIIATSAGWQWIFFINVPVIAITLWAGLLYINKDELSNTKETPDIISGLLLTSILLATSFLIHVVGNRESSPVLSISLVVEIILASFLFVQRSRRKKNQLIDKAILTNGPTRMSVGVTLLMGAFFTGYLFLISLTFQSGMKYTAAVTGLLLFPFSVLSALTGKFLLPALLVRFNVKQTALLGMSLMFMGGLLLSIGTAMNYPLALVLLSVACVTGLGIAISFTSLMVMSVQSIPSEQHGVTAGLVSTAYFLGGGLGLSLLSAFMSLADNGVNQLPLLILTMYAVVGILLLAGVIKVYVKAHSAIDVVHN